MALKNVNRAIPVDNSGNYMPFMDRDFGDATTRITRNIQNNRKESKSKTDFDILYSGGAPGIGMFLI